MRYDLTYKPYKENSSILTFYRKSVIGESLLCRVTATRDELEQLICRIKNEKFIDSAGSLSFFERLTLKFFWKAQEWKYIGKLENSRNSSFIEWYLVFDKKGEKFVYLKTKNATPYKEENCGFNYKSVIEL